jgi:hypothetical protein
MAGVQVYLQILVNLLAPGFGSAFPVRLRIHKTETKSKLKLIYTDEFRNVPIDISKWLRLENNMVGMT